MRRYAVYGGSFDPIHAGHLSMVERAIGLDYAVILVPAFRHAFGKRSAPFVHRVRMCALALAARQLQDKAHVCPLEQRLATDQNAPVYTYDVLCHIREKLQVSPCLLVGPDIDAEWKRWYRHADIDREFGRLCLPMTHAVRSTDIRQRLNRAEDLGALSCLVPDPVLTYIIEHRLYRDETSET